MTLERGIPAMMLAELVKPTFFPVALIYLDWPGGALRFHTNAGSISWDGETWLGVGDLLAMQIPEESFGIVAAQASLRLAGTLENVLADAQAVIKNRTAKIYSGVTTTRGGTTVAGAVPLFEGVMDGSQAIIEMNGDNRNIALEVVLTSGPQARSFASILHSQEDQERAYPGDTAGRHCQFAAANSAKLVWVASS